ncbi:hypothetical protein ACFX2F_006869 [Malus domestica]
MPALLNMMSSFPDLLVAVLTAFSISSSFVTSQWTKEADEEFRSVQTNSPKSSCTSAITTLAPCFEKTLAVDSPMPLAPPSD